MAENTITLSYNPLNAQGIFVRSVGLPENIWMRLRNAASELDRATRVSSHRLELPWPHTLTLLRTFSELQVSLGFRFETDASSAAPVAAFIRDFRAVRAAAGKVASGLTPSQLLERLGEVGWNFDSHALKPYQLENLQHLVELSNGANFSVPGAGKTTVTFALHLLTSHMADHILVVAPNNAIPAWEGVVQECLSADAPSPFSEAFVHLTGGEQRISALLLTPARRLMITYDQLVRIDSIIEQFLSSRKVHLVLDESHRMKAGALSRRGAVLLRMGHLAVRRDVLSGTPMPQSPVDLQSQLDFLWPGHGLGSRINAGEAPRSVLGNLSVRTTKQQLGLPPRKLVPVPVSLSDAHIAFYAVLKDHVSAQGSQLRRGDSGQALIKARRSVMRLLQCASNPAFVARRLKADTAPERAGLLDSVIAEGTSQRLATVIELTRKLVSEGRKVLIWTIFTQNIADLHHALTDLDPALIYGDVVIGDEDDDASRQGQIRRFKTDPNCKVMIANPAAAAEGISLHMQCHDAIYVDRSYNATHYLQSIDRIHRLGLPQGVDTTIYILQNKLPLGVGSIDLSVSRRLITKIKAMDALLSDPDLHELAMDEEDMPLSVEDSMDLNDVLDIIAELENPTTQLSEEFLIPPK